MVEGLKVEEKILERSINHGRKLKRKYCSVASMMEEHAPMMLEIAKKILQRSIRDAGH
jgi:uncharacterized OsmC-like protein